MSLKPDLYYCWSQNIISVSINLVYLSLRIWFLVFDLEYFSMWFISFLIFHQDVTKKYNGFIKKQSCFSSPSWYGASLKKHFKANQKYFLMTFRSYSCSMNCHISSSWAMIMGLSCSDFLTHKMPFIVIILSCQRPLYLPHNPQQ